MDEYLNILKNADMSLPVTVEPFANIDVTGSEIISDCKSGKTISVKQNDDKSLVFTIKQKIGLTIPLEIGAIVTIDDPVIDCCERE